MRAGAKSARRHARPCLSTDRHLVIGGIDIPAKEQLVLRSLLRVMDGKNRLHLRFSDTLSECNVVLVPADYASRLPITCVGVHLLPEEARWLKPSSPGLSVRAPLRLSNTGVVLQAAAELLEHGAALLRTSNGLPALMSTLLRHTMARERRTTLFPLADGRHLIVNFPADCYYCAAPLDDLLAGRYLLQEPRRASEAEVAALAGQAGARLRDFLWLATIRLIDSAAPDAALSGHFRLRRWPDAIGLTRPGFPLLAALLTSRAHTIEQASKACGASVAAISWFLRINLALGIAESVEAAAQDKPAAGAGTAAVDPAPSMLSRIRDRLKLW
ncbi:hypothetical protein LP420_26870 [Massilia sp. B-10]|nr:hypothetical protein LP420_26870 [Massilia sp. B-10]